MAVLQKMRDKFGIAISVIIALSLLYFIAPMSDLMNLFGGPDNVGEIAGKNVTQEEFQSYVDKYTKVHQVVTGSTLHDEASQKQVRDAAWEELINTYLFIKNAKAAGINVSTDELTDLIKGENISPIISNSRFFAGNDGVFDPDALVDFVQNLDADENGYYKAYWDYLQNAVETESYFGKYNSLFAYSFAPNALTIEYELAHQNTSVDVDFVRSSYPFAKDSTIAVSAKEIKNYYASHKKDFKRDAGYDIEFVEFDVYPSKEDIAAVRFAFNNLYEEFKTVDNVKSFILKNSDQSFSERWYKKDELRNVNARVNEFVNDAKDGISEVIESGSNFYAVRVLATAQIPDSAYVKHIMLQGIDAASKADSLVKVLEKGGDFAELVAKYSADKYTATDGELGNLGWMTQNYMIPGWENIFLCQVNKPVVMTSQYGTHVVLVTKKSAPVTKKQVAILEKATVPSKETINGYYSQANTLASMSKGNIADYHAAVDSLNLFSRTLKDVREGSSSFGSAQDAREVSRWIYEHKPGNVSGAITINNKNFFVVAINAEHKAGIPALSEVSKDIENILYAEKMHDKACSDVATRIAGLDNIHDVATMLNSKVESKQDISLSASNNAIDPAMAGAIYASEDNKLNGPVAGFAGVYVFVSSNRQNDGLASAESLTNMALQKAQFSSQYILPVMINSADVKDNRARFF